MAASHRKQRVFSIKYGANTRQKKEAEFSKLNQVTLDILLPHCELIIKLHGRWLTELLQRHSFQIRTTKPL